MMFPVVASSPHPSSHLKGILGNSLGSLRIPLGSLDVDDSLGVFWGRFVKCQVPGIPFDRCCWDRFGPKGQGTPPGNPKAIPKDPRRPPKIPHGSPWKVPKIFPNKQPSKSINLHPTNRFLDFFFELTAV